jgi:hypothetical protein
MRLVSLTHERDGEQRRHLRREVAEDGVLDATARTGAGIDAVAARANNAALTHLHPRPRPSLHLAAGRPRGGLLLVATASCGCRCGFPRRPPLGAPLGHVLLGDVHVHRARRSSLWLRESGGQSVWRRL